jgi:hypothetical protein
MIRRLSSSAFSDHGHESNTTDNACSHRLPSITTGITSCKDTSKSRNVGLNTWDVLFNSVRVSERMVGF